MTKLALLLLCAASLGAEIVDRIAVTIETTVITESQVLEEARITAFLNGEQPDLSPAGKRRTADRLVEQALIQREMQLTRYPGPPASEIRDTLAQLQSRYGSPEAFEAALRDHGITRRQLEAALLRQAATLQFIDLRFKPEIQVQEPELMRYYSDVFLPEARRKNTNPVPSFDEARTQCEEALIAAAVDKRVDAWIKEARSRTRIHYQEEAFQ